MSDTKNLNLDYNRPVQIAEGVFWVGFYDKQSKLHCNPYLILEGEEAVLIDGGSRPDFSTVMMKVLQTGVAPRQIKALIYHHYDPDLCGNIPNFEDIIDRDDLRIISDVQNNIFIRHYGVSSQMVTIDSFGYAFEFSTGRRLEFHMTPYAHSPGSFITYDTKTKTLFTSDLMGSYTRKWDLFLSLHEDCKKCSDYDNCPRDEIYCPLPDIMKFHEMIMTSRSALKNALNVIKKIDFEIIAPQHGSVVTEPGDIKTLFEKLTNLEDVGIDRILKDV